MVGVEGCVRSIAPASEPGRHIVLRIASVGYRGVGVSRDAGIVTFVPRTLPGELVTAEVVSIHKNFQTARLVAIEEPSPDRIESKCLLPDGTPVPGCAYDFAAYPAEVALKASQLRDLLRNAVEPSTRFIEPIPSPRDLGYRNKTVFHVRFQHGRAVAGYFGEDNRTVIDIDACPLSMPEINEAWRQLAPTLRAAAMPQSGKVTLRHTRHDGTVAWDDSKPPPLPRLVESSPVGDILVPAEGFYQVNPDVAAAMVGTVSQWLSALAQAHEADFAIDLCCGSGVFAFAAARAGFAKVTGVESFRPAVKCARANAEALGLESCRFLCRTAEDFLSDPAQCPSLDGAVAIADPPRSGLERRAVEALCASSLRHAVLVSCDPSTLARDLGIMKSAGFSAREVAMFDMFPRTIHFETAVLLERQ